MEYYLEEHYIGNDEAVYYLCKGDKAVLAEFYDEQLANKVLEFLNESSVQANDDKIDALTTNNTVRYFRDRPPMFTFWKIENNESYLWLSGLTKGWTIAAASPKDILSEHFNNIIVELTEQQAREQFPDAFK